MNDKKCCGNCRDYKHENAEGEGVCTGRLGGAKMCSQEACEDWKAKL